MAKENHLTLALQTSSLQNATQRHKQKRRLLHPMPRDLLFTSSSNWKHIQHIYISHSCAFYIFSAICFRQWSYNLCLHKTEVATTYEHAAFSMLGISGLRFGGGTRAFIRRSTFVGNFRLPFVRIYSYSSSAPRVSSASVVHDVGFDNN